MINLWHYFGKLGTTSNIAYENISLANTLDFILGSTANYVYMVSPQIIKSELQSELVTRSEFQSELLIQD